MTHGSDRRVPEFNGGLYDMADAGELMTGKRGLVMGVANDHSIAWGIARTLASQGAEVAFTYQGDAQAKRLKPLAASIGSHIVLRADVEDDASLDEAFAAIKKRVGRHRFPGSLDRRLRQGMNCVGVSWTRAAPISEWRFPSRGYSFIAVARRAAELMSSPSSRRTRRRSSHAHLSGRLSRHANLQCHGCGESGP